MKAVWVPVVSLVVLSAFAPSANAVGKGKAAYVGGTIAGIKEKSENPINLKDETALQYGGGLTIPWTSVGEVEYGQKVGHRIGQAIFLSPLVLFKKSRHHYVTVNYKDTADKDQAVVLEFDKDDIRMALTTLKTRTGKAITFTDDEARKQMGGGLPSNENEEKKQ